MHIIEVLLLILISFVLSSFFFGKIDKGKKISSQEFLLISLVTGLVIAGFSILLLSLITHNLRTGISLFYVFGFVTAAVFWKGISRSFSYLQKLKFNFGWHQLVLILLLLIYWLVLWQVMIWDKSGLPYGVLVGWGDGAYHLNIISRLAFSEPFRLEQPIAADEPLTYPFMLDFLSVIFKKIGLSNSFSWHLAPFILGSGFLLLLYFFGLRIFENRWFAIALVFLVFFGAGFGFYWFFQDIFIAWNSGGWQATKSVLLNPPHEYTHLDNRTGGKPQSFDAPFNIVWIVPMVSFFSHQRSFILGAVLSLIFLFGLLLYRKDYKNLSPWFLVLGFLPLSHTHSFLSMAVIAGVIFFQTILKEKVQKKEVFLRWILAGFLVFLLAFPQVYFLSRAGFLGEGTGTSFFKPHFGWMTCTHSSSWFFCDDPVAPGTDSNVFWFWLKNFGLIFIFWLLYLIFLGKKSQEVNFLVLPSIAIFLLPNLVLLQPWEFDNNKALFYWWFLASIFSLMFLKLVLPKISYKWIFVFLFLTGSGLSGTIDILARAKNGVLATADPAKSGSHFGYFSQAELEVADWISKNTRRNDAFLTGDGANQFIPMTTGRPIYLGFTGWLWTQGRGEVVALRQKKIQNFVFSGDTQSLCEDGVGYWLAEPAFYVNYPTAVIDLEERAGTIVYSHVSGRKIVRLGCRSQNF